jgi:hypothetical protein
VASAVLESTDLEEPSSGSLVTEPDDPANLTPDKVEEDSPTSSVDVLNQATAATLSGAVQESEEIAIHRCLTLKTLQSEVLYCLTFF